MPTITELRVNLSKYINPDGGDVTPVDPADPVVPDTGGDEGQTAGGPGTGLFTTESTPSTQQTGINLHTTAIAAFAGFFILIALGILLPRLVGKFRKKDALRYDLGRKKTSKLQIFSAIFASGSLLVGLFSSALAYVHFNYLETKAAEKLTLNAEILNTDSFAYIKDTLTLPASDKGYQLYIYADDEKSGNKLAADWNYGIAIDSISATGSLTNNTYGYSFVDPSKDATKFNPISSGDNKTSALTLTSEETKSEKKLDIWYGVRSKDKEEGLYRVNIKYDAIESEDISLQRMTPEICAELEEGVLDYLFRNELDGENYRVSKLKDGNCYVKKIADPDNPGSTVSPENWHDATDGNIETLKGLYGITDETTEEEIAELGLSDIFTKDGEGHTVGTGNVSVADFEKSTISFLVNNEDETIVMPVDVTLNAEDHSVTVTMPEAPESHAPGQAFLGWGITADGSAPDPLYQPGDVVTFESPDVKVYAIWTQKTAKALYDTNSLMNFVYDYYTVDEVNADKDNYKTNYEATLANNASLKNVYEVPINAASTSDVPWYNLGSWGSLDDDKTVISVNFDDSFVDFKPTSTLDWFCHLRNLRELNNLENLNTSEVTDMTEMFRSTGLKGAYDFASWDVSKVKNMRSLFYQNNNFTPHITGWDTSNVTNMQITFSGTVIDESLKESIETLNTDSLVRMTSIFNSTRFKDSNDYSLDLSKKDISAADSATGKAYTAWNTSNLQSIEGSFWKNTSNFTFDNFYLDLTGWDTSNVRNMGFLFQGTRANDSWQVVGLPEFNTKSVSDSMIGHGLDEMFQGAGSPNSDFKEDLSGWDVSNAKGVRELFGSFYAKEFAPNLNGWNFASQLHNQGLSSTFSVECETFAPDIKNWTISDIKDGRISYTFDYLKANNATIDLSNWSINADSLYSMFHNAQGNITINLTGWENNAGLKNLDSMFSNLNGYETDKDNTLTFIGLERLYTSNVTSMKSMFAYIKSSFSLDLSNLDMYQVTSARNMFTNSNIKTLILPSSFGTGATTNAQDMFAYSGVERLYAASGTDWATRNVTGGLFSNAQNLVGGKGTTYGGVYATGLDYAHIDEGETNPGYFTDVCEYYGTCEGGAASGNFTGTSGRSYTGGDSLTGSESSDSADSTDDTTEPETVTVPSAEDEQTEPYGVFQRTATDKTDYALIIVTIISIALILLGALIIFLIEKRERDEDDDIEEY